MYSDVPQYTGMRYQTRVGSYLVEFIQFLGVWNTQLGYLPETIQQCSSTSHISNRHIWFTILSRPYWKNKDPLKSTVSEARIAPKLPIAPSSGPCFSSNLSVSELDDLPGGSRRQQPVEEALPAGRGWGVDATRLLRLGQLHQGQSGFHAHARRVLVAWGSYKKVSCNKVPVSIHG